MDAAEVIDRIIVAVQLKGAAANPRRRESAIEDAVNGLEVYVEERISKALIELHRPVQEIEREGQERILAEREARDAETDVPEDRGGDGDRAGAAVDEPAADPG